MRAGSARTRVTIQRPTTAADAVGQRIPTWATVAQRWGDLVQRQGTEQQGPAMLSVTTWELRIRYETALAELSPRWRVTTPSQTFDVGAVYNVNQRNRELRLTLTEVV